MIVCPTCSTENNLHEKHCTQCGRSLEDLSPSADLSADMEEPQLPRTALMEAVDLSILAEGDAPPKRVPTLHARRRPLNALDKTPVKPRVPTLPALSSNRQPEMEIAPELARQSPGEKSRKPRSTMVEGMSAIKIPVPKDALEVAVKTRPHHDTDTHQERAPRVTSPMPAVKLEDFAPPPSEKNTLDHHDAATLAEKSTEENPRIKKTELIPPVDISSLGKNAPKSPRTTIIPSVAPPNIDDPPKTSPQPPGGSTSGNGRLVIVLFVLMLALGVAGGVALTWDKGDDPNTPAEPNALVDIPEGPFLKGLSNDYRLIFREKCEKLADNPDTECKEEIALKGEIPQKETAVEAFQIFKYETSNAEWQECVDAGSCAPIDYKECSNWTPRGLVPFQRVSQELRQPNRPAVCVSLDEASAYCAWKGGRLPQHDEWEKAARGTDAFVFPWGTVWNPLVANWAEQDLARTSITGKLDGHIETAPVDSLKDGQSPYGLHHMAGNAAEWIAPEKDGSLIAIARGGSWLSTPLDLRSTFRQELKPTDRRTDVGFRCAKTPQ